MFGKRLGDISFLLFLIFSSICYADTRSDQPGPLFGDVDGTNAGRYRSVKFSNGSTTNNGDGSISVTTGGAGSGYATIQDETTPLTQRTKLNFTGAGVSCADNAGTTTTDCTINGGGSASAAGGTNAVQYNSGSSTFAGAENIFSFNGTNVGIGTTNGRNLFDVQGTVTSRAFQVTSAGNVGVGSATPGQALDVQGTVRAIAFIKSGGTSSQFLKADGSVDATAYNTGTVTSVTLATPSSTLTLGGTNPVTTSGTINADIDLTHANTWTGQQIFNTANVGINSATPGQRLDVQGTIRSTQIIDTGITASKVVVTDSNKQLTAATNLTDTAYSTAVGTNPTATVGTAAVNGSSANFIRADGAPAIDLTMVPTWSGVHTFNATPIAFKTGTGNVGINSATPGQILDVQGTVRQTGFILTGNGAAAGFMLQSNGTVGVGTWVPAPTSGGSGTVNSGTTGQVGYYASSTTAISGSSALIVSGASSGNNIGIGSATPGALLDVQGTIRVLGSGNIGIGTATPGYSIDVNGGGRFLGSGNTSLNTTSGNVGIGTTLSLNKLDVAGAVSIGTTYAGYSTAVANGMIIQGNVGIGSTNPGQKFDVQGTIRMLGITSFAGNNIKASLKASANQACNTTCTSGGCLMGEDTSVLGSFVDCADATADRCICLDGAGG